MLGKIVFLFSILHICSGDEDVLKLLVREKVVPDAIAKVPPRLLEVKYGSRKDPSSQMAVTYGNILKQNETLDRPALLQLENADSSKSYLLMMIDPDPPTRNLPFLGHIVHWVVANIPGSDMSGGETLVEYLAPNPPLLSGLHRFVFVMYEQPYPKMHFDKRDVPAGTTYSLLRFKTKAFAQKYNLGDPVAANFFKTRYQFQFPTQ